MATIITSGQLLTNIATDLADNNSGAISAADVRNNMEDTVASINAIVASGDTNVMFPFWNDVRFKKTGSTGGTLIVESGILFPNGPNNPSTRQVEPFLGVGNLQHNQLGGLTTGDPHTQYLPISGSRPMTGNLQLGNNWIGSSGNSNRGLKFVDHATSGTQIFTSGTLVFGDNSIIKSGRGVAKAWINFDGSGVSSVPVVNAAYNITALQDLGTGKFRVTFASGVLGSNNYVAVGSSNARNTAANAEDFDRHTVGMVSRAGTDPNRTLTFNVLNELGQYVDGEINNIVIFENGPGVSTDSVSVS